MEECPRCGGEMRDGVAFVRITVPSGGGIGGGPTGGMIPTPRMGMPGGESEREASLKWREKTGGDGGFLGIGGDEKTMDIKGNRCLECGYIELYVEA